MNRKIIWGVPIAMVVLGLLIVMLSYLQPAFTATVQELGQVYYTPAKRSARSRRSARYRMTLRVTYTDGQGRNVEAEVPFETIHPNDLPKPGDVIAVTRSLTGMVTHPDRRLVGIGGGCAVIGGFFLFTFLLTRWSLNREKKNNRLE